MVLRFNKKEWIHYFLIYFLIIVNQSCLYEYFLDSSAIRTLIFVLFAGLLILKYKKQYGIYVLFAGTLLACITITRFLAGGIGLGIWIGYLIPVMVCVYAVNYDIEKFWGRFVRLSVFLGAVGLFFFFFQIVNRDILKKLLPIDYATKMDFKVWTDEHNFTTHYFRGYGLFLFTYRDGGDALLRNKGLFTEAGICQMLYNSALFATLYFPEKIGLTQKQMKIYLSILIASVITVQSTSGYIVLAVLLIGYLLLKSKRVPLSRIIRKYIIGFALAGTVILLADYVIRGDESFINVALVQKFFSSDNEFEVHANGLVRFNSGLLSLWTMLCHPLGIGADGLMRLQLQTHTAGGGAGIFGFGAIAGVVPFVFTMALYIVPVIKTKCKKSVKFTLLFMIFWSLWAQSNPFYSLLFMFPVFLKGERIYEHMGAIGNP